jgi:Na+/proline symporter
MLLSRLGPVTYRYIPGGTDLFCFLPGKAASLQCRTGHSNLIWPLALFFPMCAAFLLLPNLADPSQSYALLVNKLLPSGVVGLVITGLFAHTMAMTSSDANAVSAVAVRDMLPALRGDGSGPSDKIQLLIGISCTFCFLELSMLIALMADRFGGVVGLIVLWYGALAGPIAVPILLGMLRGFRRSRTGGSHWILGGRSGCLRPGQSRFCRKWHLDARRLHGGPHGWRARAVFSCPLSRNISSLAVC